MLSASILSGGRLPITVDGEVFFAFDLMMLPLTLTGQTDDTAVTCSKTDRPNVLVRQMYR